MKDVNDDARRCATYEHACGNKWSGLENNSCGHAGIQRSLNQIFKLNTTVEIRLWLKRKLTSFFK